MKNLRFHLNAMRYRRYEVYEVPDEEAEEYLNNGVAVEVEVAEDLPREKEEAKQARRDARVAESVAADEEENKDS